MFDIDAMSLSGNWINLLAVIVFDLTALWKMHHWACRGGVG